MGLVVMAGPICLKGKGKEHEDEGTKRTVILILVGGRAIFCSYLAMP